MARIRGAVGLALATLLLTACGGGDVVGLDATQSESAADESLTTSSSLVVIRYDRDRDRKPDVVTLDASRNPFVIVEALRGIPNGHAVNVTEAWRGQRLDPGLDEALRIYLADSFSVASATDLDIDIRGDIVPVTVIE